MAYKIDFSLAASDQIEAALGSQLEHIRLARNMTQAQVAKESGVSLRTIRRLEKGQGVSLDTFIRVLAALGVQGNLESLLPDPTVRPVERMGRTGKERKRARPTQSKSEDATWAWGDDKAGHE
ncbi:helix-turn-helix domain-containing protein [Candidatus Bipolaricaulota bacterium]|nr:helix-turn-helix domain-containing protein [Candidatus Bipolaricaulota bacterium]